MVHNCPFLRHVMIVNSTYARQRCCSCSSYYYFLLDVLVRPQQITLCWPYSQSCSNRRRLVTHHIESVVLMIMDDELTEVDANDLLVGIRTGLVLSIYPSCSWQYYHKLLLMSWLVSLLFSKSLMHVLLSFTISMLRCKQFIVNVVLIIDLSSSNLLNIGDPHRAPTSRC